MAARIKLNRRSFAIDFRQDRAILMMCIGIALVFWLLVKLSQTYRSEKSIILSFRIPQDQAFAQAPPEDMVIEMEGTGWDLMFEFFASSSLRLQYDLLDQKQISLSRNQLRSDIQDAFFSRDLQVVEINYDRLDLTLEEKITKKVPVVLKQSVEPASEHQLRRPPLVNPDSIRVTGPISMVNNLDNWATDSLILAKVKNNTQVTVRLSNAPPELQIQPLTVDVDVRVEQITQKSLFVPLQVVNASDSVQIFPRQISVTCILGISLYDRITQQDFGFQVDMATADADPSYNTIPIELVRQPDSVRNIQFTPKAAKYFIVEDTTRSAADGTVKQEQ